MSAAALVLGVWASLELSRRLPSSRRAEDATTRIRMPTAPVEGFMTDLGYLPEDGRLGFVEVPGGPFTMGSDPAADSLAFDAERWSDSRVQGSLDLPAFLIGRYEVTVAQYAVFIASTGHPLADPQSLEGRPDHPVTWVSWTDAVEYARWLDGTIREAPSTPSELSALLGDGWSVRLPTEAQWEKAARGTDQRIYPWGDEPSTARANYRARGTTPVGSLPCPECPHGLSDMSGNVWEWTRSPYQAYPYDPADDGDDLASDALWVMRGGSFADTEHYVRVANRGGADPGARRPFIGFRVVLSPF
jgi:formylglycine-generating enzyme required for sulfatase activity